MQYQSIINLSLEKLKNKYPEIFKNINAKAEDIEKYKEFYRAYESQCDYYFKRIQNVIDLNNIKNIDELYFFLDSNKHSIKNEVSIIKKYLKNCNQMKQLKYT